VLQVPLKNCTRLIELSSDQKTMLDLAVKTLAFVDSYDQMVKLTEKS
jgi:hypothetical protein